MATKTDQIQLHEMRRILTIFLLLLLPCSLKAQSVMLGWNPSASTNVVDYKIYYGTSHASYTFTFDAGNATNCVVSNLVVGVHYYFVATAINAYGAESPFSNEAIWPDISGSPGGAPWFW
jgi:hypothetical protein